MMFITWKEIYLLLKILGTVGTRGKQGEELCLGIAGVCVRLCLLHCVSAYMFVYIYRAICAHTSVCTHAACFYFEVSMVSWPNEMLQGYVGRESLYES